MQFGGHFRPSFAPGPSIDATSKERGFVVNAFIERLIAAHRMLNREIRRELARRNPDAFRLAHLKKQRLAVKDRLFHHIPDAAEMRRMAKAVLRRARLAQT